jgi:hypothetical protein
MDLELAGVVEGVVESVIEVLHGIAWIGEEDSRILVRLPQWAGWKIRVVGALIRMIKHLVFRGQVRCGRRPQILQERLKVRLK